MQHNYTSLQFVCRRDFITHEFLFWNVKYKVEEERIQLRIIYVIVPLWELAGVVSIGPEFNSLAMLVDTQLEFLLLVGIFNFVVLNLYYLFLIIWVECL